MTKRNIEYKCQCGACKGTGVFVGYAERDGSGVVCSTCNGTGFREMKITYEDFDGRVPRDDITQVLRYNPGISIGENKEIDLRLTDFGGMSYRDWAAGDPFPPGSEMRRFSCPAWWYQAVDYEKKPSWDECLGVGAFSSCTNFSSKEDCWKRWDKEFDDG